MTTKQMIKEYVDDHFKHFGFYPYDVEDEHTSEWVIESVEEL